MKEKQIKIVKYAFSASVIFFFLILIFGLTCVCLKNKTLKIQKRKYGS